MPTKQKKYLLLHSQKIVRNKMAKNTKNQTDKKTENVKKVVVESESFIQKHLKIISIVLTVVLIVIIGIILINRFYLVPRQEKANSEMFMAEKYFGEQKYDIALNGDGNNLGFLDVINNYKNTKAGKISNYYAGISYLKTGDFDNAIKYLSKFKSKDQYIFGLSRAAIGDAYIEKNEISKAIDYYKKAVAIKPNKVTTPEFLSKLGMAYELNGDNANALKTYKTLVDNYPDATISIEGKRSIGRLEGKK